MRCIFFPHRICSGSRSLLLLPCGPHPRRNDLMAAQNTENLLPLWLLIHAVIIYHSDISTPQLPVRILCLHWHFLFAVVMRTISEETLQNVKLHSRNMPAASVRGTKWANGNEVATTYHIFKKPKLVFRCIQHSRGLTSNTTVKERKKNWNLSCFEHRNHSKWTEPNLTYAHNSL